MSLTGSGLDRANACPASEVLPHSHRTTSQGAKGTGVHGFLQSVPAIGREKALAQVADEELAFCEALDLEALPLDPKAYAAEVAFSFNVNTGAAVELGRGIGRKYSDNPPPGEIRGTADVVGLGPDFTDIYDWKTTFQRQRAKDSWQLRFYALAACRAYGKSRARVTLLCLKEDGGVYADTAELDELDLDAFEADLAALVAKVAYAEAMGPARVTPHEGDWCRYCKAFNACPAKVSLVRELAMASGTTDLMPFALNEETAPLVYERLKAIEAVTERMWSSVQDFARVSPIALPNGDVYGEKQWPSNRIDPDAAMPLLKERFGAALDGAVKKTLPLEAVKELLRAGPKGGLKKAWDVLWAELVAAGAARTTYSTRLVEHRPKAALPATSKGE